MSNKEYMNIYNGCLKDECLIKKYLPLKDSLIKIIKHYDNSGCFERGYYDIDGINICLVDFMKDLFQVFDKVMKDNMEGFDEYVDFIINMHLWYEEALQFFRYFAFGTEIVITDFHTTCNYFYRLCIHAIANENFINKYTGDNRIINAFKAYLYYYKNPYVSNITKEEKTNRQRYIVIGPRILATFISTNNSMDCLNRLLDKIYYDSKSFNYMINDILGDDEEEKQKLITLLDEHEYTNNVIK